MLKDFKRIGFNGVIYLITAVFSKGLNILLLPIYTRYLTVEEYGAVSLLLLFKSIAVSILGLGQIVTIKKTYYGYRERNKDFVSFFSTIIIGTLIIDILLVVLISLIGKPVFDLFFEGIEFWNLGFYVLLSIVFLIPYQNLTKLYQSRNESLKFSSLEISFMLLDSIISLVFIIFLASGTLGKVYGILFSTVIIFICVIPFLKREVNFKFNYNTFKNTLLIGLPIIPHSMANLVLNLSDRMFLNKANGLQVVGLYSMAYQVGQIIDIIALSFIEAWSTFFMKNANDNKKTELIAKFALYFIAFIGSIVVFLSLYAKELINIFFDDRYSEAYLVIPIIALSYFMKTIYYVTNQQMILKDKTNLLLFSTGIASVINIGLNYLLIHILQLGMYGAAFATLISIGIMSIISYRNGQNVHYIKYDKLRILSVYIVTIMGVVLNYILITLSMANVIVKILIFVLVIILLMLCMPKGDFYTLKKIIKSRGRS